MPRTTLNLENDAIKVAKVHARRHDLTFGQAVSHLIRRGAERPLIIDQRNGFAVVRLPKGSPTVTAADVDRVLEEFP
jgi:hypothetical protein